MDMTHEGLWGHGWVIWKTWNISYVILGWVTCLIHASVLYIVHSSPFLCVCGDDRITCYSGADDLTSGPGDA